MAKNTPRAGKKTGSKSTSSKPSAGAGAGTGLTGDAAWDFAFSSNVKPPLGGKSGSGKPPGGGSK